MAETTEKYGLRTPSQNEFFDVKDISENMEKLEGALTEFDDSGTVEDIKSFPDFLTKLVTGNKLAVTIRNLKAGLQFVLHAGQIVNNCVTDNATLPLSAAQGKVLKDLYTQLYSEMRSRMLVKDFKDGYVELDDSDKRYAVLTFHTENNDANQVIFEKETAALAICRNGVWTEQYRFATKNDLSALIKWIGVSIPIGALAAGAEKFAQTFDVAIDTGYTSAALAGFTLGGSGYTNCSITKCFLTGSKIEWSIKNLGTTSTGEDLKLNCQIMLIKRAVTG